MTVVADRRTDTGDDTSQSRIRRSWEWVRRERHWVAPTLVAVLDAVAFAVIAPNVNDIFAATARESAVQHGVGLRYWFSWFGGGSTPGNYSVITPYLSAAVGAVGLVAIASALVTPVAWLAVRGTAHPVAAVWVTTVTAGLNMWSGRVPFALGCLFAVASVAFLRNDRRWPAAVGGVAAVLSSPVSAVFLLIGLAGAFLTCPPWRRACAVVAAPIAVGLLVVAALFGQPGPESFTVLQLCQCLAALAVFRLAASPKWVKTVVWLAIVATPIVFLVPNGLGDNLLRFAAYCLPALIVATSGRSTRLALLSVSVALFLSAKQSVGDVFYGAEPTASPAYYDSLIAALDRHEAALADCRLEVVQDGTHTSALALISHAMLARGYEYQEDNALNAVLDRPGLDATTYKVWLQDNAVCFVAISSTHRQLSPEYTLVSRHRPAYLQRVWSNGKWALYRVDNPNPIVNAPARAVGFSQSQLVIDVPCACTFGVRVRNPQDLRARTVPSPGSASSPLVAQLRPDGFGWTTMTTTAPGRYVLSGSI